MRIAAAAVVAALVADSPAMAGPSFVDRSGGLPVEHVYDGGWEHFVGGGVAVLDCNGDARPDVYAAGGENPARLFVNETAGPGAPLAFREGGMASLTGVTGATRSTSTATGCSTSWCCASARTSSCGATAPAASPT
jgi:enediyne biosynthesis protein E4